MIWKIFCLLGSHWFLERPHLHISNLVAVDSVDIKGHNKERILSINTTRTSLRIFFSFAGNTESKEVSVCIE